MDQSWDDDLFDVEALLRDIEADTDRLMQMAEEDTVADLQAQLEKDEADTAAWFDALVTAPPFALP
jgi:hypothetical protein